MEVKCLHGYFKFTEHEPGEVSRLMSLFNLDLSIQDDYYTFSTLVDSPKYSILGNEYLGALATKTFEGEPWKVMKQNNLIYDFLNDVVVPTLTITQIVKIDLVDFYYLSDGLILPGSITDDGTRVTDYSAWFSFEEQTFKYSEVGFE